MTDLLQSDITEFQTETQTTVKFEQAFELYLQIIQRMINLPKLDSDQKKYLYRMIDSINSPQHLFEIFVNWKDQQIPQSISKHTGDILADLKKISFEESTKPPSVMPNVLYKLNQLKKQLEQKFNEQDSIKTDNVQINKYNNLLQQIIDKSPEQKQSIFNHIIEQEQYDQNNLVSRISAMDGQNQQRIQVVNEYYKYRKEMLVRFFDFCNLLEKKLIQFIKQFGGLTKTTDHINKIKSQYEKFKITIADLITNGVVNSELQNVIDQITPSYDLEQFREKMKQLGVKIIQDYLKDNRFSQAMTIITQISGLEITQDQILFDLILPSIIYSQIKIQFTMNMQQDQYVQYFKENNLLGMITYHDLNECPQEQQQYLNQFKTNIGELLELFIDTTQDDQQLQQKYGQDFFVKMFNKFNKLVYIQQQVQTKQQLQGILRGILINLFGGTDINQIRLQLNQNIIQVYDDCLVLNGQFVIRLPIVQLTDKVGQFIQHQILNNKTWIAQQLITKTRGNQQLLLFTANKFNIPNDKIGLVSQLYIFVRQNQTGLDKGLVLKYITDQEDIVMKITSQAIDAIYSTLLISLQAIQTSPAELSIVQIIGGAKNKEIIQGAEMFYQLFAAAAIMTKRYFKSDNDKELNLKVQLPFKSKFKPAFEYIIQRQTNISFQEFQEFIGLLNERWTSSNESTTRQDNNISPRTKSLLQSFMNDLMEGLTFSFGQQKQVNQGLTNIQVYKDVVETTGFEENFTNINENNNIDYVEKIFTQMPKRSITFNDKYQQLVKLLEDMILKQEDNYNFDDKEFSYYIREYYSNVNYQEKSRDRYVYDEFNIFVQNILEGKMSSNFAPTFLNDFGLLYYYYLVYSSNVFNILANYHQLIIDKVLNNKYIFKPDLSDYNTTQNAQLDQLQQPLFQAIFAATYNSDDLLFKTIYESINDFEIVDKNGNGVQLNDIQFRNELDRRKTIQEKFFYLLKTYGILMNVDQQHSGMNKGDILPERLDYLWQQYQYIINSKQKQIAFLLNFIMNDSDGDFILFERFINILKKNKVFDDMFKQIDEQTVKIGKIVITLHTNVVQDTQADGEIGEMIPRIQEAGYVNNFNNWTGEQGGQIHLSSNNVGINQFSRKYYLNENYENILIDWFYPDFIYPMNLKQHADIQKKITNQLQLVKYSDKGFDCSKLVQFLQETANKIIQKFEQLPMANETTKLYYKTQLQQSIDISGLIQSIFNKKIIPPCNIQFFKQNYLKLQPINYENNLDYKFQYVNNDGQVYPDLFSYENIYNQDVVGSVVMPGMEKKAVPINTKTYFFDEIVIENNKHSDIAFELNKVNKYLHDTLDVFTCNNQYKKLPKDIIEKFLSNKYIKEQIILKDIKYQDFLVNVPINGFQTPFSLPNIFLENLAVEQLHGGDITLPTSEQISIFDNDKMILRSDMVLINTCLKMLGKDQNEFFNVYKKDKRNQLYKETLDRIFQNPLSLCNVGNLFMYNTWQQIESLILKYNQVNLLEQQQQTYGQSIKQIMIEVLVYWMRWGFDIIGQNQIVYPDDASIAGKNITSANVVHITNNNQLQLNNEFILRRLCQDIGFNTNLDLLNLQQISTLARKALQIGLVQQVQIGENQNQLIILSQLLQKLYSNNNVDIKFGDNDPIYVIKDNKVDYLQQTYKSFQFSQIINFDQIYKMIQQLITSISSYKDNKQLISMIDQYLQLLNNVDIIQYLKNTKPICLGNIAIDQATDMVITQYFRKLLTLQQMESLVPNIDQSINDYKLMSLLKQQSFTYEQTVNLDKLNNVIDMINSRQALQPLFQGQLLSKFIQLAIQNKLSIDMDLGFLIFDYNQISVNTISPVFNGYMIGQQQFICAVFSDNNHNGINAKYNGINMDINRNTYNISAQYNNINTGILGEQEYFQLKPKYQQELQGGVIKSQNLYEALNKISQNYKIIDFQQGTYNVFNNIQLNLQKIYFNIPKFPDDAMGRMLQKASDKHIEQILLNTQQSMYIFNEKKQQIERYDLQKMIKNEFYKGKLITMSNAYALNKVDNRQYTLLDRMTITQKLHQSNLKQTIQSLLQYYTFSEQGKSILQTTQNIIEEFMKENYELLKTDKEYARMYDEYGQQYKTRLEDPRQMFNFDTLFSDNYQQDRFAFWMGLEAEYYIEDEDMKINDKYAQFKKIWFQLRKLKEIKKIPFQKAKMFFTRYTNETSRYIGHDHYFKNNQQPQLSNIFSYEYENDIVQAPVPINNNLPNDKRNQIYRQNLNELYKLQSQDIQNMSEQMHQILYYKRLGLANDGGKSKYLQVKLAKQMKSKNIQLRSMNNDTEIQMGDGYIPFKLFNATALPDMDQMFTNNYGIMYLAENQRPDQIFLYNSLYAYTNNMRPLVLTLHLQINSGITEPEITKSATTFGISVMPIEDNIQIQNNVMSYFNQLNSCLQNKEITINNANNQVQLNKIFKIIGVNPINAISLIKNNVQFPIINILSLFLRSYMRKELIGKPMAVIPNPLPPNNQFTKEQIFQIYIREDNELIEERGVIKDIVPKQVVIKNPNRYLQHMISNSALFLIKAKEKRMSLNQQLKLQGHKITTNTKLDTDF